jgi:cytochrome c-type biogenesis protein
LFSGLSVVNNVSFILVFFEGILSFFSPCVIPLIPVYISYLAGNGKIINEDGTIFYKRKKVLTNTLFFVIGISSTFFILGLSFSALGIFFNNNKTLFRQIGGIIIIIMGFTFSFAWTPCVGPALSSVLILASGASHPFKGNLLVLVYAIGFILPFLVLGIFTTQTLNFFKENRNFMKYTVKIGGTILIIIGILTFTGQFNNLTKLLSF